MCSGWEWTFLKTSLIYLRRQCPLCLRAAPHLTRSALLANLLMLSPWRSCSRRQCRTITEHTEHGNVHVLLKPVMQTSCLPVAQLIQMLRCANACSQGSVIRYLHDEAYMGQGEDAGNGRSAMRTRRNRPQLPYSELHGSGRGTAPPQPVCPPCSRPVVWKHGGPLPADAEWLEGAQRLWPTIELPPPAERPISGSADLPTAAAPVATAQPAPPQRTASRGSVADTSLTETAPAAAKSARREAPSAPIRKGAVQRVAHSAAQRPTAGATRLPGHSKPHADNDAARPAADLEGSVSKPRTGAKRKAAAVDADAGGPPARRSGAPLQPAAHARDVHGAVAQGHAVAQGQASAGPAAQPRRPRETGGGDACAAQRPKDPKDLARQAAGYLRDLNQFLKAGKVAGNNANWTIPPAKAASSASDALGACSRVRGAACLATKGLPAPCHSLEFQTRHRRQQAFDCTKKHPIVALADMYNLLP
jgi:hypothetical protein